jgi:CRP/FNR family transcriptional regulator
MSPGMPVAVDVGVYQQPPGFDSVPFLKMPADSEPTLLTDLQRKELARIGKRVQLHARAVVYRERERADSVFVVLEGVLKSYRLLRSGKTAMSAFLFHHDIFGLAERGEYLNSVQAVTAVTLHQLPLDDLIPLIKRDGELQFKFLAKVTQGLRESQRRAILVGRRDAAGRLAMFLMMMRGQQHLPVGNDREVPLPMSRTDIAAFLGLSREAMSRAARSLERRGIVAFDNRHLARIVDTASLAKLATAV